MGAARHMPRLPESRSAISWLAPLLMAILFGLATSGSRMGGRKSRMKLDVSIGILYTATMALAILFIGLMKTITRGLWLLFGNVLAVTGEELRTIAGLSISSSVRLALLERTVLYRIRPRNGGSLRSAARRIFSSC